MARSVHVRLDDDSVLALSIVRSNGMTDSEAVRVALREAAARRRKSSAIRAEVAALVADPDYQRETAEIQEFMDELAPDYE